MKFTSTKAYYKRIFMILYSLAMIGYGIYAVVQAWLAHTRFQRISGDFQMLVKNWEMDAISSVTYVNTNQTCPEGTEDFFQYHWPGTVKGCYCSKASSLETGVCTPDQIKNGCTDISETSNRTMSRYKQVKLCVKRVPNTSFMKLASKLYENGTCHENYRQCGGSVDSMYSLCMPIELFPNKCPLMTITTTNSSNVESLDDKSLFYGSYSANFTEAPLSQLYVNDGGICKKSVGVSTRTHDNYHLAKAGVAECKSTDFDTTFSEVDSGQKKIEFLAQNGVNSSTLLLLEKYVPSTALIKPMRKNFVGFKRSCRLLVADIVERENDLSTIKKAQTILFGVSVAVTFIFSGFYPTVQVLLECRCRRLKHSRFWPCINIVATSSKYLFYATKFIHIGVLIWAVVISSIVRKFFLQVGSSNCGEENTNKILANVSSEVDSYVYQDNLICLIVTGLVLLFDAGLLFYNRFFKKPEPEQSKENSPENVLETEKKELEAVPEENIEISPMMFLKDRYRDNNSKGDHGVYSPEIHTQ